MTLQYTCLPARALLSITGENAREFLQGLVSNDVRRASPTQAVYAALLSPQGKFLHDFFISEHEGALWLDGEKDRLDDLITRLAKYKLRAKVTITPHPEYAVWAMWGVSPAPSPGHGPGYSLCADPRHAAMGTRLIATKNAAADFFAANSGAAVAWAAYEAYRLQLGIPDGSRDIIVDRMFLLEAGLDDLHGVDFTKGCYVGQEVTARSKHRGGVRKFLFHIEAASALPPPGTPLLCDGKEVGEMRSSLGAQGIALLRVEGWQAAQAGATLLAGDVAVRASLPEWSNVQLG